MIDGAKALAKAIAATWPAAACSLREGIEETLTLTRLGVSGQLAKTLVSTNPCESMIEIVRHTQPNVKSRQPGDMRLRWSAAGMLEAERQFRKIIGYRDLANLAVAVEREISRSSTASPPPAARREEVNQTVTV